VHCIVNGVARIWCEEASGQRKEINVILLLQQHWLSNELQAWLRLQQVGPKSKQGAAPPNHPSLYPLGGAQNEEKII